MKILVLGASGMIGLALYNQLVKNKNFTVIGTTSQSNAKKIIENQNKLNSLVLFDFLKDKNIENLIKSINPNIIINCVGIIKQSSLITNKINTILLNSILPNKLSILAFKNGIKLVQISTDCVFSGKVGSYVESDNPDPIDTYGRTKLIGEIVNDNSLTLRTSLVGHELFTKNGLLEWFLSQKNECIGFKNAFFSGFTTNAFAKILETILLNKKELKGLYHISSNIISKYDFLEKINKEYKKNIKINPDHSFNINRSLNSSALQKKIGYNVDSWDVMIREMFSERFLYVQK
jgi:dTDP-4-dehydrorhamnose reductase